MTQKSLQAPVPLPQHQESQIPVSHGEPRRLPWMAIAIAAILIAAVAIALALGFVLGAKGANVPPAKAPEPTPIIAQNPAANAAAPLPVVIVTPGPTPIPQFGAAPIPGNGITLGIYTKPGKPGEMTDGGQIVASFILLAARGRIDEAMKLVEADVVETARIQQELERMAPEWRGVDGLVFEQGAFHFSRGKRLSVERLAHSPAQIADAESLWIARDIYTTNKSKLLHDPSLLLKQTDSVWRIVGIHTE
ncbi:MAG: hypothetical protein HYT49_01190 [Candidatus Wildermuthbacteria bacterium]|nr:hypothetical protein [Candidatus Wildermuthbacteria bacterium]